MEMGYDRCVIKCEAKNRTMGHEDIGSLKNPELFYVQMYGSMRKMKTSRHIQPYIHSSRGHSINRNKCTCQ